MQDNTTKIIAAVIALSAGGLGGYVYLNQGPSISVVQPPSATQQAGTPGSTPVLDLGQAEKTLRENAGQLSQHPGVMVWLKTEDILRRLTAAAALVGEGKSPRDSLAFLQPQKKFMVKKQKGGKLTIDPAAYSRYDVIGSIVESINSDKAAAMVKEMDAVLGAAGLELDQRYKNFNMILVPCMKELLSAPVILDDIEIKKDITTYVMVDKNLEHLSDAQKHLIRMGPQNTLKIQAKLRELGRALGIPDEQLKTPNAPRPLGL